MAKLVKKKKTGFRSVRTGGGGSGVETSSLRPVFVEKMPPCIDNCPNHNQVRTILMTIAKAEALGKAKEKAFEEAFHLFMETTPFPSVCGRVCPHPCESECNRNAKEGAVSVHEIERFIGDFGLEAGLVPRKLTDEVKGERIAIVGSGPAGMSCAYHLARHGYPVTVFEAFPKPGGMLRYGIPDYRLPPLVLDGEIDRIVDMGVELRLNTAVGRDIPMAELRRQYKAIFVGLGAHQGLRLGLDGEDSENVYTGTDFLHRVNAGEAVEIGDRVVVIGGGDTAIDAARVALRLGAKSTILYRRTREEMPAIDGEIAGAEEEGVDIQYLAAPMALHTENGKAVSMTCQRMELGEPDASGRRRPVPIEGDTFELPFTSLIAAISQEPDFTGFDDMHEGKDWIKTDDRGNTGDSQVYSGGDDKHLGLVIDAISEGRLAALAIHEAISGEHAFPEPSTLARIAADKMRLGYYGEAPRVRAEQLLVDECLKSLDAEIVKTISDEKAVAEAGRCMSCGYCFDCGTCWSYCQDNVIVKPPTKGERYTFKMEFCKGCKKCAENCPCGYIEMN